LFYNKFCANISQISFGISDRLLMTFTVNSYIYDIIELIVIIAHFQCMLLLAAETQNFITKLAKNLFKFKT